MGCLSFPRFLRRRIDLVHGQIFNAEKRTFSFIYCALSDLSISQHSLVRRLNFALLPFPGPQVNIGGLLFPRPSAPQRCRRVCRLQPRSPPQGERENYLLSERKENRNPIVSPTAVQQRNPYKIERGNLSEDLCTATGTFMYVRAKVNTYSTKLPGEQRVVY